jgi:hypothetical protein
MPRNSPHVECVGMPRNAPQVCGATACKLTDSAPIKLSGAGMALLIGMVELLHFEMPVNHAVFRPTGQVSMERAVELVTTAIDFARARGVRKLLVDVSNLTGFEPPSVVERYFFVHEWARAAGGIVCVALVTTPQMLDQQRFGRTVAENVGFTADAFTTEEDALIWLQGR